jgi:hypothetical protein
MKIVFLNTWNGKIKEEICEFIKTQAKDADVFCFQEVYDDMRILAKDILPEYEEFYAYKKIDSDDFPQATYVNKKIKVIDNETILGEQMGCGLGINVEIPLGSGSVHICNFHGRYKPGDKLDSAERLEQSQGLIEFFKDKKGLKIIGGDFNLFPDTRSIKMFEENGYRDLIKEYKISTTRNRLAWEMYPDNKQLFSDYVFLSPGITINNFSVPDNEISDHLPMILEVSS